MPTGCPLQESRMLCAEVDDCRNHSLGIDIMIVVPTSRSSMLAAPP